MFKKINALRTGPPCRGAEGIHRQLQDSADSAASWLLGVDPKRAVVGPKIRVAPLAAARTSSETGKIDGARWAHGRARHEAGPGLPLLV